MERYGLSGRSWLRRWRRWWSWQRTGRGTGPEMEVATDGGTLKPLSSKEIDALCEKLNGPDLDFSGAEAAPGAAAGKGRSGPPPKISIVLEGGSSPMVSDVPVKSEPSTTTPKAPTKKKSPRFANRTVVPPKRFAGALASTSTRSGPPSWTEFAPGPKKRRHEPEGPCR